MARLNCFISAPFETDISILSSVLAAKEVDVSNFYDFSIGESFSQVLKRKLRHADFALFVIPGDPAKNNNTAFEMGVCEGMGKQYFIFLSQDYKLPFYAEHSYLRLSLTNREVLEIAIQNILDDVKKNRKPLYRSNKLKGSRKVYNEEVKENLMSYLGQITSLRNQVTGGDVVYLVEEIFKTIKLNYVENRGENSDKGADFVVWSEGLSGTFNNPIIVEVKYGRLSEDRFMSAVDQIKRYSEISDTNLALLLYLDTDHKRYNVKTSLNPLIISFDLEDFVQELCRQSFDSLVLSHRNQIVHGHGMI